jgi:outer membrane protein OmpA-like peptidoglycan-associated protein
MRIFETLVGTSLVALTSSLTAFAQTGAPPPPIPPPAGATAPTTAAPGAMPYQAPPPAYPPAPYTQPAAGGTYPPAPYTQPAPGGAYPPAPAAPGSQPPQQTWQPAPASPPMTVDVNATAGTGMPPAGASLPADQARSETAAASTSKEGDRDYTFYRHNSISGATGLLHMASADSSTPGTFRLSIMSSYFSGSGFLCQNRDRCPAPPASVHDTQDTLDRVGADLSLSATLLPFLEAFAGMHSHATSDNFGHPQLLQVLGDTNLGLKGFLPRQPDSIFSVGALGELRLLNGSGSVGIHTANINFRALGTLDLSNRSDPQQRIPLRLHVNFGYMFDNSSSIVTDTEASRGHVPISRIERFGLDINRVDTIFTGFGAEYVHPLIQPFAEWTINVPSNRQGYVCKPANTSRDDKCLKLGDGFGATPSRLTFGLRATPWIKGFNATLGLDIGTGGTSKFIEELAPQLPWNLYFGIGFTYDTLLISSPAPVAATPQVVQMPPPPERHIVGVVIDEKTLQPIPNAIVRFQGRPLTGLVTRTDGSFETGNLDFGDYALTVTADGYKEGTCTATVSAVASAQPAMQPPNASMANATPGMGFDQSGLGQPGMQPQPGANSWNNPSVTQPAPGVGPQNAGTPQGPSITSIQCVLKPAPIVGTIQGTLVDAEASSPVVGARITVRDSRGREVQVQTDDSGNFRFENVPAGVVHLSVDADGYLPSATDVEVKQKGEQRASLTLNKRPKKPNVSISGKEVKLATQIHFGTNSSNILADSQSLLQEIAAALTQHSEIRRVEIQGHTDDTGPSVHNKRLSQDRAEAVRAGLVALGVESARLTAVGYGAEKPLAPNSSEANRAKNRRVQLMILER